MASAVVSELACCGKVRASTSRREQNSFLQGWPFDRARPNVFWNSFMRNDYDARTAITFLLAGLGLGTLIALMFAPRQSVDYMLSDSRFRPRPESLSARAV